MEGKSHLRDDPNSKQRSSAFIPHTHQLLAKGCPGRGSRSGPSRSLSLWAKGLPQLQGGPLRKKCKYRKLKVKTKGGERRHSKTSAKRSRRRLTALAHLVCSHCHPYTSLNKQFERKTIPNITEKEFAVFDASIFM